MAGDRVNRHFDSLCERPDNAPMNDKLHQRIRSLAVGLTVGVCAGALVMVGIQLLLVTAQPPDQSLSGLNSESFRNYVRAWPDWMFLILLLSYAIGSLLSGWLAMRLSRQHPYPAVLAAVVLMVAGFVNLSRMPHPFWFALGTGLIFILSGWLGSRWAQQTRSKVSD